MGGTPELVLWIDIETDGSDETVGHLLEVGAILTDRSLQEIGRYHVIIHHGPERAAAMRDAAAAVVAQMHDDNSLWHDIAWDRDHSLREPAADIAICAWLDGFGLDTRRVALAGSGAGHFDGRWVRRHLPMLGKRLTYWAYDVGVLRRTLQRLGLDQFVPTLNDDKPHRALEDVELHLQEARRYDWLLKLLPATVDSYDRYIEGLENP